MKMRRRVLAGTGHSRNENRPPIALACGDRLIRKLELDKEILADPENGNDEAAN
jgi:hypothetical protein